MRRNTTTAAAARLRRALTHAAQKNTQEMQCDLSPSAKDGVYARRPTVSTIQLPSGAHRGIAHTRHTPGSPWKWQVHKADAQDRQCDPTKAAGAARCSREPTGCDSLRCRTQAGSVSNCIDIMESSEESATSSLGDKSDPSPD